MGYQVEVDDALRKPLIRLTIWSNAHYASKVRVLWMHFCIHPSSNAVDHQTLCLIRYNKLRKFQNRRNENSPQNKGQGQRLSLIHI